jgi:hypothetical protein
MQRELFAIKPFGGKGGNQIRKDVVQCSELLSIIKLSRKDRTTEVSFFIGHALTGWQFEEGG